MKKFLCLLLIAALPTHANSQVFTPVPIPSMSMPGLGTYIPTEENSGLPDSNNDAGSSAAQESVTSFNVSRVRTRQNVKSYIAQARANNPTLAAQYSQILETNDFDDLMGEIMRVAGLRRDNVADAFAIYWVQSWMIANHGAIKPNLTMIQAVRGQSNKIMLNLHQSIGDDDASKQKFADIHLMQMMILLSGYQQVETNPEGDPATLTS